MTTDFRRPFTPIARLLGSVLLMLLLGGCDEKPSQLERIQERGELIVATRYGETTWQRGADGPEGIEYDLVTAFAESLGVTPRFVFPDRFTDTLGLVDAVLDAVEEDHPSGLRPQPALPRVPRVSAQRGLRAKQGG